ncbi:hypothetical protein PC129_g6193 [Phytophthora cactorum]|uniref:Serine hydrolase domain-containing protein n=1 Tax=Phytophthora cactorum TaxID=29920 RepID=A0A8T1GCY5_9STRA|nr:hypothetical protein PC118_g6288 [Phytophthora cactorum]KAG3223110.1 hypothetical protein PC129_g6193 [Phytophthora cactorum]
MAIVAENLPRPTALNPPPFASSKKIRVLCLHGFRTNKQVMMDQTRGLRAALGDSAEFVMLNGTYEARGTSDPMIEKSSAKARLQSGADQGEDHAWSLSYKGIEQSMVRIDEELRRHGPFDVVIGFSQGAALLTILTMWYLRHGNVSWWKLVICVGGVDVSGVNVKSLFLDKSGNRVLVALPSIHLIGKTDPLYHESHRLALSWGDKEEPNAFKKRVYVHDGGHKFPSASQNREFYAELGRAIKQHCTKGIETNASRL